MKKGIIILAAALIAFCGTTMAQKSVKLGHINSAELMKIMPGTDSAQTALQAEAQEMEEQMKLMQSELESAYTEYQDKKAGWTELIRQTKERQIQDMDTRIKEFAQNAQQQLQMRQEQLLQPIIDRAKAAIEAVAKENGYTYVFDTSVGALLYQQDSDDLLPLVKRKLGL